MSDGDKCIQGERGNVIAMVGVCVGQLQEMIRGLGRTFLGEVVEAKAD